VRRLCVVPGALVTCLFWAAGPDCETRERPREMFKATLGVVGNKFDCFPGVDPDAPTCFIVRRKWGPWGHHN